MDIRAGHCAARSRQSVDWNRRYCKWREMWTEDAAMSGRKSLGGDAYSDAGEISFERAVP
jgi:hypothetical protein